MQNYKNRLFITTFIVVNVFFILIARLVYLQIIRGDEYEKFSLENRVRLLNVSAPRGNIYDRNGKELVTNRASFDVNVFPNEIEDAELLSKNLSEILGVNRVKIEKKIKEAKRLNFYTPINIERDIDRDTLAVLEARRTELKGISIDVNYLRDYKNGKLASLVLGYLGKPDDEDLRKFDELDTEHFVGKTGIERVLQKQLSGEDGSNYKVIDALGREVKINLFKKNITNKDVVEGNDVVLTIDTGIQKVAEEQLGENAGAIVVMNVNTGEILALVSSPSYDPRDFVKGMDRNIWNKILTDKRFPLLDRATQGTYAPGSIFKIVPALAALRENIIDQDTEFYCPGFYKIGRKRFKCWKRGGHGEMDIREAITQSCDVYFYNVGDKLGIEKLSKYSRIFGFGSDTGFILPEKSGVIPDREWKMQNFHNPWYKGETVVTAIGQGYISVTPLQIAVMISSIANGGYIMKPIIIKKIISGDGNVLKENTPVIKSKLPFSDENMKIVRDALVNAVNGRHGTGRNARIKDQLVAGKTGTAQVVSMKTKSEKYKHEDHAWFTSYFPADQPEISVTVLVEHGGTGGSVAAPIAKAIIQEYIKDKNPDTGLVKNGKD